MFKLKDNVATQINGDKLARSKGRLKIRGRSSNREQGEDLEEPAAEGSGGRSLTGAGDRFARGTAPHYSL